MSTVERTAALRRAMAGRPTSPTRPQAATAAEQAHTDTSESVPVIAAESQETLPLRVIGYIRVSTTSQDANGYGLRAQREALENYCNANGHQLLTVTSDVISGTKAEQMYGRAVAIQALDAGTADVLLVRALDRATRDQLDAAQLYKHADENGWLLMDCEGADSGDPSQRLTADIRLAVGAEERRRISVRTKEGLARARREGKKLGRPSKIPRPVIDEIILMRRDEGMGPKAIANHLDSIGIPTPGGGYRWHYSSVRRILNREGVA